MRLLTNPAHYDGGSTSGDVTSFAVAGCVLRDVAQCCNGPAAVCAPHPGGTFLVGGGDGTLTVFDPRKPPTTLHAARPLCRLSVGESGPQRTTHRIVRSLVNFRCKRIIIIEWGAAPDQVSVTPSPLHIRNKISADLKLDPPPISSSHLDNADSGELVPKIDTPLSNY